MDHPGFVRDPIDGQWRFLGGVPARYLDLGIARREFGDFAMWDLPDFAVEDGRLICRACDDLAGCAILVCLLVELQRREVEAAVDVVFTRAEEVGFLGAIELGRAWPFEEEAVFVSLETSSPVAGVRIGSGPVIRDGDSVSFFDDEASVIFTEIATEEGIPVQRALLDRGSCEATALQHYGIRSAGISLLLGNYHNCAPEGTIAAEYVDLGDAKKVVQLLVALVAAGRTEADSWSLQEQKFEERKRSHAAFCESSRALFPCM
jgi:putative aminopeptidase FrvX